MLAEEWLQEGLPEDFPCALVSQAAQPGQQVHWTTLGALGALGQAPAPSMVIAGWTLREAVRQRLGSVQVEARLAAQTESSV